jgi:hypothetical protein
VLGETLLFMFHAFILQFARLFAKVHAKLVQPKSQIYVARDEGCFVMGLLSHPTLYRVRGTTAGGSALPERLTPNE